MPIHTDAPAIAPMIRRLRATFARLGCTHEIIFINDASPDRAQEVLEGFAAVDRRIKVVTHSRAFGTQAAFASGLRVARGDACVLLDGDLQDPPELIAAFVERWRQGYQVVYGVRVRRAMSRLEELPYRVFYRLWRRLACMPVPLDAGEFCLMDRCVVEVLHALPEQERFLRGLRAWVGFRQTGVAYARPQRAFGRSTNTWLSNLRTARLALLSFTSVPLEILALTGAGMALGGALTAALLRPPAGAWSGLLAAGALFGGINLLGLALVGEYVARVLAEVKARPPYVVRQCINIDDTPESRPAARSVPLAASAPVGTRGEAH